jgi:hypothetical protein
MNEINRLLGLVAVRIHTPEESMEYEEEEEATTVRARGCPRDSSDTRPDIAKDAPGWDCQLLFELK